MQAYDHIYNIYIKLYHILRDGCVVSDICLKFKLIIKVTLWLPTWDELCIGQTDIQHAYKDLISKRIQSATQSWLLVWPVSCNVAIQLCRQRHSIREFEVSNIKVIISGQLTLPSQLLLPKQTVQETCKNTVQWLSNPAQETGESWPCKGSWGSSMDFHTAKINEKM